METSKPVEINVVCEESGRTLKGTFTFRGTLTRRQRLYADQVRRRVLGPSPEGTDPLPNVNTEAYIIGQLAARVVDAPKWWQESDSGMDLEGWNVVLTVYDAALQVEDGVSGELKKDSEKAAKKLKDRKVETPVAQPEEE
jgi:hypothetical protein